MSANRVMVFVCLLAGATSSGRVVAGDKPDAPASHVMVTPAGLSWTDGPPSLPPGAKSAVVEGDPRKEGLFTMRVKLPANYGIPAHWHPADEHVTVISGTFHMGMGDKLDATRGTALTAGSFAVMPAKTQHYAFTRGETVIQLHGVGPWGITYVNPADDPRGKK
jgi:mannose-6-phosphate isomerase-like protein (cupin superfamily)